MRAGERVYFDASGAVDSLGDLRPVVRRVFGAAAGAPFEVRIGHADDTHASFVARLFEQATPVAAGDPPWRVVGTSVSSAAGTARLAATPDAKKSYLVELRVTNGATALRTELVCDASADRCATARQPAESCGGIAAPSAVVSCDLGLFCNYTDASCGAGDASGKCARRPEVCFEIWRPVCGCDGKTYGNACVASGRGMSVAHQGECG
jgi:hypothetical protein